MNIFLLSYIPPSNTNIVFYLLEEGQNTVKRESSLDNYINENITLISFDFYKIINYQKSIFQEINIEKLKVICIEDIAKQLTGHPLNEYSKLAENPPWNIWELLTEQYQNNISELNTAQDVYYGIVKINEDKQHEIFSKIVTNLESLFIKLEDKLEKSDEYNRFYDIEKPITELLLKVAYKGFNFDAKLLEKYLETIHNELYSKRNRLQLKYSIFSSNDYKHISRELRKIGLNDIANCFYTDENYYRLLKISKDKHELAGLLYEEMRLSRNYNALLRLGKIENKPIIPIFETFGTVTSRILVSYPSIQQLSKKYRDVLKSEKNKSLIYIDYIQFEAGILASKCNDTMLIDGYRNDIYKTLSIEVFGNEEYRDLCKIIFYKYNYGSEMEKMIDFLNDHFNLDAEKYEKQIKTFFEKFAQLKDYRQKCNNELNKNNRIGTSKGNYRAKTNDEKEIQRDVTWTVSQVIQGEASLILKKAILEVTHIDKEIEFLIPMHDAALFQVPTKHVEEKKETIKQIFRKIFLEHCPAIDNNAEIVKFKQFVETLIIK